MGHVVRRWKSAQFWWRSRRATSCEPEGVDHSAMRRIQPEWRGPVSHKQLWWLQIVNEWGLSLVKRLVLAPMKIRTIALELEPILSCHLIVTLLVVVLRLLMSIELSYSRGALSSSCFR